MVTFITFGNINRAIVFPVIGGIIRYFSKFTLYIDYSLNKNPLLVAINAGLGKSIAIIPYIFVKLN